MIVSPCMVVRFAYCSGIIRIMSYSCQKKVGLRGYCIPPFYFQMLFFAGAALMRNKKAPTQKNALDSRFLVKALSCALLRISFILCGFLRLSGVRPYCGAMPIPWGGMPGLLICSGPVLSKDSRTISATCRFRACPRQISYLNLAKIIEQKSQIVKRSKIAG